MLSCLIQCSSLNPDIQLSRHVVPLEQKHTVHRPGRPVTELPPASMMSNSLPGSTSLHVQPYGSHGKFLRAAVLVSSRGENRRQLLSGISLLSRRGVSLQHHGIRHRKISCQVNLQHIQACRLNARAQQICSHTQLNWCRVCCSLKPQHLHRHRNTCRTNRQLRVLTQVSQTCNLLSSLIF